MTINKWKSLCFCQVTEMEDMVSVYKMMFFTAYLLTHLLGVDLFLRVTSKMGVLCVRGRFGPIVGGVAKVMCPLAPHLPGG